MIEPSKHFVETDGENLIFIVGCSRSGTSYLQRLIASHPQVKTGQESHLFDEFISPMINTWQRFVQLIDTDPRGGVGLPAYLSEAEFLACVRMFLLQLMQPMLADIQSDEVFVEKTPEHAFDIQLIHQFFPKARFVHILRDARDVVASLLAASRSWGKFWAPSTAPQAAQYWCRYVKAARQGLQALPPSLGYEIRYEDLISQPMQTITKLSDFLELSWCQTMLEAALQQNTVVAAQKNSAGTALPLKGLAAEKKGMFVQEPEGFVRHGVVGSWKQDLTLLEKFHVWCIARETMRTVGYIWNII